MAEIDRSSISEHNMKKIAWILTLLASAAFAQTSPVDPAATPETRNLLRNLRKAAAKATLFGHQDDLAYGVDWRDVPGRSDVKDVTGEYPAVFGWDLGRIEADSPNEIDGIPFEKQRQYVKDVYARGGINTFSWHLNNPLFPEKTSWDKADSTIRHLFADPAALQRYDSWLDKIAVYFRTLTGPKGEPIPLIFRPFHEHTGSWFWWGRGHCTPEEYIRLWRHTVDYLRKEKGLHNLLIAYSTDRFTSKEDYLERYPGDDYVDIVGFDIYHRPKTPDTFVADTRRMVETLRSIGQEKKKIWAITETGLEKLPVANWWTEVLTPVIQDAGLAYVLVWRNGNPTHFYAPYPGQTSAEDFRRFAQRPDVWFGKKAAAARLYNR